MAKTTGEIFEKRDIRLVSRFEWKVALIKSVFQTEGNACESPPYSFCNEEWTLKITRLRNSVNIHLNRHVKTLYHKINVECEFKKINSHGVAYHSSKTKCAVEDRNSKQLIFKEPEFQWNEQRYCDVKISCLFECFHCKPVAPEVLLISFEKLGRDFLNLLIDGEESDMTIKVKERVFKVHRNIIRARSPVFFSMLKHDMVERISGEINISDCEPEAFWKFLEYLYSGRLKNCSKDIACSLYYIMDKYEVLGAKSECVKLMSRNLSLKTFCDIATVAIRHKDFELLENANRFFSENSKAIIQTDRWLSFLKENPVDANDFLIKLLVSDAYCAIKKQN